VSPDAQKSADPMAGVLLSCLFLVISVLDHANARDATTATVGEKAAPAIFPGEFMNQTNLKPIKVL